jgi:hypothetical protein
MKRYTITREQLIEGIQKWIDDEGRMTAAELKESDEHYAAHPEARAADGADFLLKCMGQQPTYPTEVSE